MKAMMMAAAGMAVATMAGAAQAQTMDVQKPIRVLVGGYFPKEGGDTVFSLGVTYDFHKSRDEKPTVFNAYVDYLTKSGTSVLGVGAGLRGLIASPMESGRPYYGASVGFYTIDPDGGSTKSKFGGKALLGYELNNGWFGEVDYTFIGKVSGFDPSGTNVRVGYRF